MRLLLVAWIVLVAVWLFLRPPGAPLWISSREEAPPLLLPLLTFLLLVPFLLMSWRRSGDSERPRRSSRSSGVAR